jgi:U3 small nucleolar RNA-associated protein 25
VEESRCVHEDVQQDISLADAHRDAAVSSADDDDELSVDDDLSAALDEPSESEEDANNTANAYGRLLQSLKSQSRSIEPVKKKRKLLNGSNQSATGLVQPGYTTEQLPNDKPSTENFTGTPEIDIPNVDVEDAEDAEDDESNSVLDHGDEDVGDGDLDDLFESHFANPDTKIILGRIKAIKDHKWTAELTSTSQGLKKQYSAPAYEPGAEKDHSQGRSFDSLKLKRRILAGGRKVWSNIGIAEQDIASAVFTYKDVLFGSRTFDNAPRLRDLVALHALNHVFKTRDRVIKNNSKISQDDDGGGVFEFRDQGFTRPKILFILPTRQACVKYIDSLVRLCQPEQQENKSRFMEGFAQDEDSSWEDKPRDFQELFGGNDDDMFRIGLKFTRKTLKFFSAFYNSDIILASPLGLRTAIESGGSKDGKKASDADFLSSIEVVVMDHANALLMQNWQHVEFVFSQLNLLPKESHGCDFSRVRHWYLDGEAKYIRQTIVLAEFTTPEINSIYSSSMLNVAGKLKYAPTYEGAMIEVSASLPARIPQVFIRFNAPTPTSDADLRFTHFTSTILPLLRKSKQEKGTLIFMSSYLDFVRVRNHFSTSTAADLPSFGAISEYTSVRDVARARSHFLTGRQSVLLYSERSHHFRRYRLKGVKRVLFYSLPENPVFWSELVCSLSPEFSERIEKGKSTVRALFSRWDVLKLERIVGTSRVGKMVNDKAGDTFEFT